MAREGCYIICNVIGFAVVGGAMQIQWTQMEAENSIIRVHKHNREMIVRSVSVFSPCFYASLLVHGCLLTHSSASIGPNPYVMSLFEY